MFRNQFDAQDRGGAGRRGHRGDAGSGTNDLSGIRLLLRPRRRPERSATPSSARSTPVYEQQLHRRLDWRTDSPATRTHFFGANQIQPRREPEDHPRCRPANPFAARGERRGSRPGAAKHTRPVAKFNHRFTVQHLGVPSATPSTTSGLTRTRQPLESRTANQTSTTASKHCTASSANKNWTRFPTRWSTPCAATTCGTGVWATLPVVVRTPPGRCGRQ